MKKTIIALAVMTGFSTAMNAQAVTAAPAAASNKESQKTI